MRFEWEDTEIMTLINSTVECLNQLADMWDPSQGEHTEIPNSFLLRVNDLANRWRRIKWSVKE